MDVPCRVSAERIELQLIRAAPGNPNAMSEWRNKDVPPRRRFARIFFLRPGAGWLDTMY